MNIFKKILSIFRKDKSEKKEDECWCNAPDRRKTPLWIKPEADGAPWSDNSVDIQETMKLAKK